MKRFALFTSTDNMREDDVYLKALKQQKKAAVNPDIESIYQLTTEIYIEETRFRNINPSYFKKYTSTYGPARAQAWHSLKSNCIVTALFTLKYLQTADNYLDLTKALRKSPYYVKSSLRTMDSQNDENFLEQAYRLFDQATKTTPPTDYCASFISGRSSEITRGLHREINSLQAQLAIDLMYNQAHNRGMIEKGTDSIPAFNTILRSLSNNNNKKPVEIRRKYRNNLRKFCSFLYHANEYWKCKSKDYTDKLLHSYTTEFIFHTNAFCTYIDFYSMPSYSNLSKDDFDDWFRVFEIFLRLPLLYGHKFIVYFLTTGYHYSIADIGDEVFRELINIYKGFFSLLYQSCNRDINSCIKLLEQYVKNNKDSFAIDNSQYVYHNLEERFEKLIMNMPDNILPHISGIINKLYHPTYKGPYSKDAINDLYIQTPPNHIQQIARGNYLNIPYDFNAFVAPQRNTTAVVDSIIKATQQFQSDNVQELSGDQIAKNTANKIVTHLIKEFVSDDNLKKNFPEQTYLYLYNTILALIHFLFQFNNELIVSHFDRQRILQLISYAIEDTSLSIEQKNLLNLFKQPEDN